MTFLTRLLLILCSIAVISCGPQRSPHVPDDVEEVVYSQLRITNRLPHGQEQVPVGLHYGLIHQPGLRYGVLYWRDGKPASMGLELAPAELQVLIDALTETFADITPVYTHSSRFSSGSTNPDLGLTTSAYHQQTRSYAWVSMGFSGITDDYNREMWLEIPERDVDAAFWRRLAQAGPADNQRYHALIAGLQEFWQHNVSQ
ncbi:MAG: hypothetical protein EA401_09400 [Planctomycetota bacterium]|nr:MAG: hypothetical protein EA401_09400 [Planctomycetota bacterium]